MKTLRIYQLVKARSARKKQAARRPSVVMGRVSLILTAAFLLFLLGAMLAGGFSLAQQIDQLPSVHEMKTLLDPQEGILLQPSRIVDRSGENVIFILQPADLERQFLSMEGEDAFSTWLPRLTVAVEDPDFWERSVLEVFIKNSDTPAGITENLAGDLLLWQTPHYNRFGAGFLSAQLLLEYGHEQVLTWHLNTAEYGHRTYGAEQAAQLFLGKSAAELNLAEAALLVASAQSPALNPWDAPAAALENKDQLLVEMQAQGVITLREFEQAMQTEITLTPIPAHPPSSTAPFIQAVLAVVEAELPRQRLERGGFTIRTTLDAALQQQLACSTQVQFERIQNTQTTPANDLEQCPAARLLSPLPPAGEFDADHLQASAVVLDPRSGEVLAMVDRLTASGQQSIPLNQQPGSLLSPFVALTAFTRGSSPATMRWDIPGDESTDLTPFVNADETYQGPIRTRTALANDDTLIFAEWMEELGTADVLNLTRQLGWDFTDQQSSGAGLLFQGGDTNLLQTALTFSTFANLGTQTGTATTEEQSLSPILILSIAQINQEPLALNCVQPKTRSLLSPALAFLVHDILSDEVSRRATLGYPSPLSIGRPSAAMIAAAENDHQSWTLGYTPERLVVTWFGAETDQSLDYRFSAGLWHALMQYSTQTLPAAGWTQPAGISQVIVCDPSGLLPTADCPSMVSEIFITGNEPGAADTLYHKLSINRETGKLATVFTPLELIEEKTFLIVPPKAQSWARQMELPVPPDTYDAIVVPSALPDTHITTPAIFSFIRGKVDIIGTASGSGFSSYRIQVGEGLNPQEWFQIGDASQSRVRDDILAQWDTTALEGLYAMRLIVQRGTQEIETATIQITVDNTPPTMTILSPQPGETVAPNADGEVNLQVRPEDNLGVASVHWYLNGVLAAERTQLPFTVFLKLDPGNHLLMIEVVDLAGNSTRSEDILFRVE